MNTCCLHTVCTPSNECVIIVERKPWGNFQYCTRIGTLPTTVPWSTSWRIVASILLHAKCTSVSRWSSCRCKFVNDRWALFYSITSGYRIILMLSKNVGIGLLHCQCLCWNEQEHCYWPIYAILQATAHWYCDFLETALLGLLKYAPLILRRRLWFQHDDLQHTVGKPAGSGQM